MKSNRIDIMNKTADRIRHFRLVKGFSQECLALSAGINTAYLGLVERSVKCPSIDTLNKIANALNIPLYELVKFDDDRQANDNHDAIERITLIMNGLSKEEAEWIVRIVEEILCFKKME